MNIMINEFEQEINDFDWFFTNGVNIGFVASGGGKLPSAISESRKSIEILSNFFRQLLPDSDFIISPELSNVMKQEDITDRYFEDFIFLAKRGIFAFDKTIVGNWNDTNYHLVAKPLQPIKLNALPKDISETVFMAKNIDPNINHLNVSLFG